MQLYIALVLVYVLLVCHTCKPSRVEQLCMYTDVMVVEAVWLQFKRVAPFCQGSGML